MANEQRIAAGTHAVLRAMADAHETLRDVLRDLENVDRKVGDSLSGARNLAATADPVRRAETTAERLEYDIQRTQGEPAATRDRLMEQLNDADIQVRQTFVHSQRAAGELASQLGGGLRDLGKLRDDLEVSAGKLKGASSALDELDQLEGFAGTDEATQLRTRLGELTAANTRADTGLQGVVAQLDETRRAAGAFEYGESPAVGSFRHSRSIEATSESLTTRMANTRNELRGVGNRIYEGGQQTRAAVGYAAGVAKQAGQKEADLVNAVRAATNPSRPGESQVSGGNGAQDPRLRADGQSRDSSRDR